MPGLLHAGYHWEDFILPPHTHTHTGPRQRTNLQCNTDVINNSGRYSVHHRYLPIVVVLNSTRVLVWWCVCGWCGMVSAVVAVRVGGLWLLAGGEEGVV